MKILLKEIIDIVVDNRGKNPSEYTSSGIPVIDNYLINDSYHPDISTVNRYISNETYNSFIRCKTIEDDVLITLVGNGYGNVTLSPANTIIIQNTIGLRTNNKCNQKYLYYLLLFNKLQIKNLNRGCAQPSIKVSDLLNIQINLHSSEEQVHIVNTIGSLDDLIEINTKKITKLEDLIELEYKKISDFPYIISTLENEFDISIGRTPPRNEKEWFTTEKNDILWVSIKDMGEKGLFIYDTNEKLIPKALDKFNYIIAHENDILMSFKLTVGKISIAGTNLVTNEAIATFKPKKEYLRWFLYCYLKSCDFNNAGSTSSIATAINSTILKKYKFPVPTEEQLASFNFKISNYIHQIKSLILKNIKLNETKNKLLSKFFK